MKTETFDKVSLTLRTQLKQSLIVGACEAKGCYPLNSFRRYSCPNHDITENDLDEVTANVRENLPKGESETEVLILEKTWGHFIRKHIEKINSDQIRK